MQGNSQGSPGTSVTAPASPGFSVPSTWLIMLGVILEGGNAASFVAEIGDGRLQAAIATFGAVLIGAGAWLAQHGH